MNDIPQIQVSYDYDKFKFKNDNRNLNKKHIDEVNLLYSNQRL